MVADEDTLRFHFVYNTSGVTNGEYRNAVPCFHAALGNCGWLGLRFTLLFGSGPNHDRSIGGVLGFNRMEDYESSVSQHRGGSLGSLPADGAAPAFLEAPSRYIVEQLQGRAIDLAPVYTANRPPTIELPFRTRAQLVALAVPVDAMRGECTVRESGAFYVGPSVVTGKLEATVGVGNLVNRFYAAVRSDVTLRDYQFVRPHAPDPSRATASFQWDFAVVVTSLEVVMVQDGVVAIEGFVGGQPGYHAGQLDPKAVNEGWVSIGVVNGSAGAGPFTEGQASVFTWPHNTHPGALFKFTVVRTAHQAKWGMYRAFPRVRHIAHVLRGMEVAPRLARVTAGVETPLPGIRVHDLDLGEARVSSYQGDVRRVTATLECLHGVLFVDAPQAQGPANQPGGGARFGGSTLDDEAAMANMGDVELGGAAGGGGGVRSGNPRVENDAWAGPDAHGGQAYNLAKRRGVDAGGLHFFEGSGIADRRMVFSGPLRAVRVAVAGLRYLSRYDADPGGAGVGARPCAAALACGQVGGYVYTALGGYGGVGYDELSITIDDEGHSDRLCTPQADPLGACVFSRGVPQQAVAKVELTVAASDVPGAVGARAGTADAPGQEAPCQICYAVHPADADLCVHQELYPINPNVPGHSYKRSALEAYTEAQRRVWKQEFGKACMLTQPGADNGGALSPRNLVAGARSPSHGDPGGGGGGGGGADDAARLIETLAADNLRPWDDL